MTLWSEPGERKSARTFELTLDDGELSALAANAETPTRLRYDRPTPNRLVLGGHLGKARVELTLVRRPPPLRRSRGFHWVSEFPFNR